MKKVGCFCLCLLMVFALIGCAAEEPEISAGSIRWPHTELVSRLPVPETLCGEVQWESADDYSVDLTGVTQEQFNDYVDACMDNGFKEDYYRDSSDFWAYDTEGYYLTVDYDSEESVMNISIECSDGEDEEIPVGTTTTKTTKTTTSKKTTTSTSSKKSDGGLSADFKAAMDSYEQFMDEYVAFMKKYSDNPSDLGLLVDYARFMGEYATFCEEFAAWEDEDLSDAELAYYLAVQTRVNKKLLEVAD